MHSTLSIGTGACRSLVALTAAIAVLSATARVAWADPAQAPQGDWSGTVTLSGQAVRLTVNFAGATRGSLHYGSPLDCSLNLAFVDGNASAGYQYALQPPADSPGMAPYCNRLLYGRALFKPDGRSLGYAPTNHDGQALETGRLSATPAVRDDRH